MSTTTITLLATATAAFIPATDAIPATTPAMGRARFERTYRSHHGAGEEVPAEVHTAPMWAGPDAAEAHEALCAELADDASTLETVGDEGYVLLHGAGDGCDVWARYTTA